MESDGSFSEDWDDDNPRPASLAAASFAIHCLQGRVAGLRGPPIILWELVIWGRRPSSPYVFVFFAPDWQWREGERERERESRACYEPAFALSISYALFGCDDVLLPHGGWSNIIVS